MNYESWHTKMARDNNPPLGPCVVCGTKKTERSLKVEFHVPGERVHVEDPSAYEPCCRSCHGKKDAPETLSDALKTGLSRATEAARSPEAREKRSAALKGRRPAALDMKRRCTFGGCKKVSTPGGIGMHQRATGHYGVEDLGQ